MYDIFLEITDFPFKILVVLMYPEKTNNKKLMKIKNNFKNLTLTEKVKSG